MYATYTGLPTQQGEQVQVRLEKLVHGGNSGANAFNALTKAFCLLEHDEIVKIKASGVEVVS